MKSRMLLCTTAIAFTLVISPGLLAQNQPQPQKPSHYRIITLGTLGGTNGSGNSINDLGWASGASATTGNAAEEATLWRYGKTIGLGTLGGPNSSVAFPAKDDVGILEGIADVDKPDPLGENFCAFNDGFECWAFWWTDENKMVGLPTTLGGNNSRAAGVDDFGHVVGWAETSMQDPTCIPPAVLQYVPTVWNIHSGQLQQLPTLSGDPDGAAVAINQRNQIVGISGPCGDDDGMGARHAVLWQNGTVMNLGNFGGQYFNTAAAINNLGVVAGWSDVANDTGLCDPHCYAFVWTKEKGIQQVGPLPGDSNSLAYGINDEGQIVGQSLDAEGNSRAFLWQDGKIYDLNGLVPPGSPSLLFAGDINDLGEIIGEIYDQSTQQFGPAYLAVPTFEANVAGAAAKSQKVILPANIRREIMQHLGLHHWELANAK